MNESFPAPLSIRVGAPQPPSTPTSYLFAHMLEPMTSPDGEFTFLSFHVAIAFPVASTVIQADKASSWLVSTKVGGPQPTPGTNRAARTFHRKPSNSRHTVNAVPVLSTPTCGGGRSCQPQFFFLNNGGNTLPTW